ncbi:HAD family hydrolase [Sanguibacter sp. HDW7]|uniref:HAD family hydrolase n=1 Tax=Sanguibacter sp. HDW7 TaxID=2714931 RepID=UPI001F10061B|nr:HAD family hydrolase [Sanguibacter sp. HDW7]
MTSQGPAPRLRSASDYERFGDPLDLPRLGAGERFLVALDVDGTIMSEDGFVSAELRRAVALLRAEGHHVVLATGRPLVALLPVAAELGLVGTPLVAANGSATAVLREDGSFRLTDAVTFRPERALDVLLARMPATFFAVEEVGVGYWVGADFPEGTIMGRQKVVDLALLEGVETTRICAVDAGEHDPRLDAELALLGLDIVHFTIAGTRWLDVAPHGVTKASALEDLRVRLGVRADATVAVGDGGNDVEMLGWAAQGVAMGHATADVVAAADRVTGPITDDGAVPVLHDVLVAGRG